MSIASQDSLRRSNLALSARVILGGLAKCAGEGLEGGLHDVVGVAARQLADVQRHPAGVDQRLEEMLHQLHIVGADPLAGELQVAAQVRPP
jgi:hypothetical protein